MRLPVLFAVLLCGPAAIAAEIHRCPGDAGEILYSHQPCGASTSVAVRTATSAPAQGLRPGERAYLAARASQPQARAAARSTQRTSPADGRRERAYACSRKRAELDKVKAQLRRGYKPARGEQLRRRRASYEDYLDAFCS